MCYCYINNQNNFMNEFYLMASYDADSLGIKRKKEA